ncbi:hypothetical protein J2Z48_003195 [Croceifilum oryzae]|uniref:Suppressor of fused-like domain-containing protein n=1 Tax=Croceifilum oryzae TaxID=1553429 RepID=A0AAJ1TN83_9BACL|nr:suppressor of fused domain protein [Croceifilum oryzae]MDQ0418971.1 hypothetical protein [Croceifilum oryzae]
MSDYIDFLESHLGEIEAGTSKIEGFQVARFTKGPFPGTVTYSTLGMSHHYLKSPVSNKEIRMELFFVSYSEPEYDNIPGILEQVGREALEKHQAYLAGEVIGPRGKLFEGTQLEALYVAMPVYFPDSFHVFYPENDIPIVQAWLVPITSAEAGFIRKNGWSKFEDILEKVDPDVIDFNRSSVV